MQTPRRRRARGRQAAPRALLALALLLPTLAVAAPAQAAHRRHPAKRHARRPHRRRPAPRTPGLANGRWIGGAEITEYFPVPESWFKGQRVAAPGLTTSHRVDWLYSARGVSMEGEGIGLDGQTYHIDAVGDGGWIDATGAPTSPGTSGASPGPPWWRAGGYWLTKDHAPTFPLEAGGWLNNAPGTSYVPLNGVSFAPGPSRALTPYASIAVDPHTIALGSRVFVPAYAGVEQSNGWFTAADTGGAITGAHIDVYRTPPPGPTSPVRHLTNQQIYVVTPGTQPAPGTQGPPPATPPPGAARAPAA